MLLYRYWASGIWIMTVYYKVKPKTLNKGTTKLTDTSRVPIVKGLGTFVVNKAKLRKTGLRL